MDNWKLDDSFDKKGAVIWYDCYGSVGSHASVGMRTKRRYEHLFMLAKVDINVYDITSLSLYIYIHIIMYVYIYILYIYTHIYI